MERRPPARPPALNRAIQIVQQNLRSALDPRPRVGAPIRLPLDVRNLYPREREGRAGHLFEKVGLDELFLIRNPQALSGAQLQRVAIARALAGESELILSTSPPLR